MLKPMKTPAPVSKPQPTFVGIYWCGVKGKINTITLYGDNAEAAEVALHQYLDNLSGKGEWGYIITEKKLKGTYNNVTKDYLATL